MNEPWLRVQFQSARREIKNTNEGLYCPSFYEQYNTAIFFRIIMFVGSTVLGTIDRLSVKSVLTGKTGSLLGLLASAIFIIISFVIFIGPIIYYFQGDYT